MNETPPPASLFMGVMLAVMAFFILILWVVQPDWGADPLDEFVFTLVVIFEGLLILVAAGLIFLGVRTWRARQAVNA